MFFPLHVRMYLRLMTCLKLPQQIRNLAALIHGLYIKFKDIELMIISRIASVTIFPALLKSELFS